jgi:hypothetical protein
MNKDSKPEENNRHYNKENYFKVPEGYFESLPDSIFRKINAKRTEPAKKQSDIIRLTLFTSAAAAIVVILIIHSVLTKHHDSGNKNQFAASDTEQTITEYLIDNLDESTLWEASSANISFFDADKLKEMVASDDSIIPGKEKNTFEMDTALKKDDILEYLLNENIDPETL